LTKSEKEYRFQSLYFQMSKNMHTAKMWSRDTADDEERTPDATVTDVSSDSRGMVIIYFKLMK